MANENRIALIKKEIEGQLGTTAETSNSLLATVFKGFDIALMKRAMLEGMMRGFTFQNFLEKDVYAIKYGDTYSLVTSIDYSRKIGAKSGIVGVEAPIYKEDGGKIISCSVTVHKKFADGTIGDFTAEPYFSEYTTGKNLWSSKPRTMLAKVAEMHALRKACPEELAQSYVEEEMQREVVATPVIDLSAHEQLLRSCKTLEGLEIVWADMPGQVKAALKPVFEEMKAILITESKDITVD